ncbi:unnamed protein product, partial [Diabrotica balteata]
MDWKYLQSVDLEDLNDDEKDDLYNNVTWFDVDSENLDENRYKVLVRACQEILKYKGEQVETLLHELEEMAIKQAEEEARRQESEADVKSSKSKKSSSLEYENLEHKYLELKAKHKKAVKINEKHEGELTKLNNKLKVLEQENKRLQNELQTMPHDAGSESDYSESIRDRQKELVETIHNKNIQISDLLRDIEEVEQENIVLREKLTKVKDELSLATKDLENLKDLLSGKDEEIKDQAGNINKINQEYEELKKKFESCHDEKLLVEKKLSETTEVLNKKVEELKEQLYAKNEEIENLRLRLKEPSLNSSLSSLPKDDPEPSQTIILQKSLNDKDQQLRKLKDVVSRFRKEKDDFTDIINKLKAQKKQEQQKLTGLQDNTEELKKQLKTVHERCQKLHDDLVFAEKNARCKDEELKDLLKQLHGEGKDELAVNIQTLSELKSENRSKEKQIISLVKATNKLQEVSDILEKENCCLRQLQNLLNNQKLQFFGYVPIASEETYINNLITVNKQKHETFLALQRVKHVENEAALLKEKLDIELDYLAQQKEMGTDNCKQAYNKMANWMQEKKNFQINEIRLKRQLEFKQSELQHYVERVKSQDDQILKLDQELLQIYKYLDIPDGVTQKSLQVESRENITQKPVTPEPKPRTLKASRPVTVQTENLEPVSPTSDEKHIVNNLKSELITLQEENKVKETQLDQLKSKITEHEMTISMFRKQIGDKQSQITFYERHIMDLQNKKTELSSTGAGGDNVNVGTEAVSQTQEQIVLKNSLKSLQEEIKSKDEQIMKYQTLLKNDRDKHSLAAARLQEELQNLQKQLMEETQKTKSLEEICAKNRPNRAALEQYVSQVHALEKHASELHTKLSTLEVQLQSSRQESIRWRTMANDRLTAMEDLRKDLDKQHQTEMVQYKSDIEKMRDLGNDEINTLRQLILRQKGELTGRLDMDIQRLIREKDDKIHEMIVKLRQVKTLKKSEPLESESTTKFTEMESAKDLLTKEHDLLKRRYEQLLIKEKNARDEIRELKTQLLKKPISARSDKSDKSIKDQLQKKVFTLENEIIDLKQNLSEQIAINEAHRVQANEDFEKWKKMKYFQQTAEKLKNKLKERDNEFEKLQQTNTGYRMAIERLEREKRNLENRVKTLKASNLNINLNSELETLRTENLKLLNDVDILKHKLEMQQHHAGALGATMLQEKLEGQERKIAILELSAKGSVEVRTELDRLQTANSNLQKSNLRLEAENLDLKLDLEKSNKEVPHLHQQIQHLENYIDVLKSENSKQQVDISSDPQDSSPGTKKVSELERTVFILKRVVEKLQAENKRLVSGKRPLSDRSASADKLKRDHVRLKEQHSECKQRIEELTKELEATKNTLHSLTASRKEDDKSIVLARELSNIKDQLEMKSSLLDKVKILLHRAAAKEKALIQE